MLSAEDEDEGEDDVGCRVAGFGPELPTTNAPLSDTTVD